MKKEPIADKYSLSPMQQGMLFHSLSAKNPGVDIEQILCEVPAELNPSDFNRAWQRVVERHAILRTGFSWEGGDQPRQEVWRHVTVPLQFQDWRNVRADEQAGSLETFLEVERNRGFDLTEAPLMRVTVLRLGDQRHQIAWTFHHLLLDGRAVVVVLNELFAFYEAFNRGEDLELPEPGIYRSFIDWLHQQDSPKAEAFWRKTLKGFGAPTTLNLPRPAGSEFDGVPLRGEQEIRLSRELTLTLKASARNHDLTLNTLLQGAWALLLSRYSGEEDVVFGAVRAGRRSTVEGADSMVGLFINTVPVRVRVDSSMSLLPWFAELRNNWVALRPYEHTPLVDIQGWSDVPRGAPLFETLFNFQDPSWDDALRAQGGAWVDRKFGIRSQSNYPLVVDAYGGDAIRIKILYQRDRFDQGAIARMLGHLETLLAGIAQVPARQISSILMMTETERHQLLTEWNETEADFPKDKCIHQLFEEQALRTPTALAVTDSHQRLTYAELNERSDLLARSLQSLGVGPETRVAVCLNRSVGLVVGKLAVWKAGGAYVPLDPAYPTERLAFMLQDAQVPVMLTTKSLMHRLQPLASDCELLCVDEAGCDYSPLTPFQLHSKNLAYVIYTSGSTGFPKGVEIEHAGLANLIAWHHRTYHVTSSDRATQIATPAFDASVWELWPYLTAGASIHIPDEEIRLSPARLLVWLKEHRITITFIPTPMVEAMFAEPWLGNTTLRAVLTGGDKLHRPPPDNFPCMVLNHYGPTENTVVTTWTPVAPAAHAAKAPPIGRPISNTRIYVLDRQLRPVPIGVPGELHVAGAGLARGYLNRPDLTDESFVTDPFNDQSGGRLYKTGDLVRWQPDGSIEFLGRLDHQVKIRGNRIELGEIESALGRHSGVREAVVMAVGEDRQSPRLVAYVVAATLQKPTTSGLREHLQLHLPDYMVPTSFVFLDALPLTPNGKLDRKALPSPLQEVENNREFIAPRTPREERLAAIWREVLGISRVGVHDNFFELGGHSLLATQVVSRAHSILGGTLSLRQLFATPTIAGLAETMAAGSGPLGHLEDLTVEASTPDAIVHIARNGETPISSAQERIWFLEQFEPGQAFNNIPVALRLEGVMNRSALERAVDEIVRRHATFRTVFRNHSGRPVASVEPAHPIAIQHFDFQNHHEAEREPAVQRLLAKEARRPFDLAQSPLMRTSLLRLGGHQHVLLLVTHHIACDGWSMGILFRELGALYEAFNENCPSPLPELPIDYADFAQWQRHWLPGHGFDKQLAHWKNRLHGAPTGLDLPTDRPRPPVQSHRGASRSFAFPSRLSVELKELGRREEVTLFMILLAGLQTVLHRYSGQDDICIGSPIAGRTKVETENLIGLFLNTLVLRGGLSGDPTFHELLRRTRQTALDAYAHQDAPFEKLVDALLPERDLSRPPLFQVMLALQNEPFKSPDLPGIKSLPVHVHSGTAKFDLMFSIEEAGDGLGGFVEYNTDLFDESTIARLLDHFQIVLEAVVIEPLQRLSTLPLLSNAETRRMLVEWNDTGAGFARDQCIHQMIQAQVTRTPDKVAVVFGDDQLTYRELDDHASCVAAELRALGVGPEVCVGICIERSLEMMVGLLGILKAGGAYVPLDPAYPRERLAFMLEDSQAPVLLTQRKIQAELRLDAPQLKVLFLDPGSLSSRSKPVAAFPPDTSQADNLAYVIYTSGSTGKPKGVMLTHRNVANFFAGMDQVLGAEPGVWLAVTSISFDISVLELFWTLARGFKVVIQPEEPRKESGLTGANDESNSGQWRFVPEQILRHSVTHMQCTPSLAGALVLAPESLEATRRLSKLLLGGEALPASLAETLRQTLRGDLINMYGPTETTVWSTAHRVGQAANPVPIGRPIANTQIYILDQNLQPVPAGVPGELFIGGEGVARGYLNRPELTSERFVPIPESVQRVESGTKSHSPSPSSRRRLYRTGDLARYLADGTIEFLGRIDHQVKLRGFRIELGEIESILRQHPSVCECVVHLCEITSGDQRLVAYLVPSPGMEMVPADLRHLLKSRLPEFMMPAAFVTLKSLPLTPNGKVDRKALPKPDGLRPQLETAYTAPGTRLEKTITGIWRELLHVEQVGLHDNFFDLGGHSLLVVQAQARLREVLNIDLPVVKLFQHPTVRSLAKLLQEKPERSPFSNVEERARRQRESFARQQIQEVEA